MRDQSKFYGDLLSHHKNQNEDLREQNEILQSKLKLERAFATTFAILSVALILINIFK